MTFRNTFVLKQYLLVLFPLIKLSTKCRAPRVIAYVLLPLFILVQCKVAASLTFCLLSNFCVFGSQNCRSQAHLGKHRFYGQKSGYFFFKEYHGLVVINQTMDLTCSSYYFWDTHVHFPSLGLQSWIYNLRIK